MPTATAFLNLRRVGVREDPEASCNGMETKDVGITESLPLAPNQSLLLKRPSNCSNFSVVSPRAHRMSSSAAIVAITGLLLLCGPRQAAAIQLWNVPGAIPRIVPASCRAVLVQNITCANNLVTASEVSNGMSLMGDEATEYCTTDCYTSLQKFQTNVRARCGDTMYAMYAHSTLKQSGTSLADGLVWAYNVSCIQDT
jgi:hypothetical protein